MRSGRKPLRECLPSREREDFVSSVRRQGRVTLITERQKNRYVDEFLRFCSPGASRAVAARDLSTADILNYAKYVERHSKTFGTGFTKVSIPIQWFNWLAETGRIESNPAENLNASQLVARLKAPR